MARLIAAIPWIVAQDGASLDEISARFDYPRELLLKDLEEVVFFVGVPPYTPDTLIEVTIDDDMVWISYAEWFQRPMKLSGGELLSLLAAGETALSFDNQDEAGALARGLAKLRLAAGGDQIDVQIGSVDRTFLPALRGAADGRLCVDIDYYSFGTNARSERRIEPNRFFVVEGNWYVGAHCQLASADRIFRVERIEGLTVTEVPFTNPEPDVTPEEGTQLFTIDDAPRVTIAMPASRLGILDSLPIDEQMASEDGAIVITLPASSARWLEQLLVRIGPGVRLIDDGGLDVTPDKAASVLAARYGVTS